MSERDELLARAKSRSMDFAQGAGLKSSDMLLIRELETALRAALAATDRLDLLYSAVAGVRDALRAALAARPQPLFDGTVATIGADHVVIQREDDVWPEDGVEGVRLLRQRVVVYPAVAGSATPTGDDDE